MLKSAIIVAGLALSAVAPAAHAQLANGHWVILSMEDGTCNDGLGTPQTWNSYMRHTRNLVPSMEVNRNDDGSVFDVVLSAVQNGETVSIVLFPNFQNCKIVRQRLIDKGLLLP